MNKFLYSILLLSILYLAGVYILIPDQIVISKSEQVESSERIIKEYLANSNQRRKWWPESITNASPTDTIALRYNSYSYTFKKPGFNFVEVLISDGANASNSVITWSPLDGNVMKISWRTSIAASSNPVRRFSQYLRAHKIKANMDVLSESFLTFIVDSRKVYGHTFKVNTVKDTILATSVMYSPHYPETQEVYKLIHSVKNYIGSQNIKQVNAPMLNISKNSLGTYQTMVALPVGRRFKPASHVLINFMVPGNILVTEIKGGPKTIDAGFNQMQAYMKDFKLTSPAIPFQLLSTDRIAEPDTAKWITKLYYPIY